MPGDLLKAAKAGDVAACEAAVRGADIDEQDEEGRTALHHAAAGAFSFSYDHNIIVAFFIFYF